MHRDSSLSESVRKTKKAPDGDASTGSQAEKLTTRFALKRDVADVVWRDACCFTLPKRSNPHSCNIALRKALLTSPLSEVGLSAG